VKERYRASAQLSNNCEHVFAPKKDTSTSIKTREEDKKQQTLLKKNKKREEKKFRSFSKLSYFLLSFVLTLSRSLLLYSF
tara:strand:- start:182 stop:421 length:240 start_codon:yes stop_codon:yes gene_type:complete